MIKTLVFTFSLPFFTTATYHFATNEPQSYVLGGDSTLYIVTLDYESAYYYAMALYLSNDISNARKQFQMVADFIENSESRSLNRAIMLLYCKYFLDDSEGFNDAFLYVEDMVDLLTEEEKKKLEGQLTKVALINDCFIKDEDYARPYHYKLAEIGREIRSGNGTDKEWCQEQLERIAKYRDEWSRLLYCPVDT